MRTTSRTMIIPAALAVLVGGAVVAAPTPVAAAVVLTATPNPVVIPIGETTGVFDLTWDGGNGQPVELVFQRSGQAPDPPQKVAAAGTQKDIAIAVAEIVTVTMTPEGGGRPLAPALTVVGVHPEGPTTPDCTKDVCVSESSVEAHGTWARVKAQVADVDSVFIDVNVKDDQAVTTHDMMVSQGVGEAVLWDLKAATVYEYTVYVVDYFGNKTEEHGGVFETLTRRVEVEFIEVEVLDDSDDLSPGDFSFYFQLAGSSWQGWSGNRTELDTGEVEPLGVVLTADGVGTSVPFAFNADDDDSDVTSGLCTHGLPSASTGEDSCHSWLTLTGTIDASATGFNETFTVSGAWDGSNSDDMEVRLHWQAKVGYV